MLRLTRKGWACAVVLVSLLSGCSGQNTGKYNASQPDEVVSICFSFKDICACHANRGDCKARTDGKWTISGTVDDKGRDAHFQQGLLSCDCNWGESRGKRDLVYVHTYSYLIFVLRKETWCRGKRDLVYLNIAFQQGLLSCGCNWGERYE